MALCNRPERRNETYKVAERAGKITSTRSTNASCFELSAVIADEF